jgi:hypothetical protein
MSIKKIILFVIILAIVIYVGSFLYLILRNTHGWIFHIKSNNGVEVSESYIVIDNNAKAADSRFDTYLGGENVDYDVKDYGKTPWKRKGIYYFKNNKIVGRVNGEYRRSETGIKSK